MKQLNLKRPFEMIELFMEIINFEIVRLNWTTLAHCFNLENNFVNECAYL